MCQGRNYTTIADHAMQGAADTDGCNPNVGASFMNFYVFLATRQLCFNCIVNYYVLFGEIK